MKRSTVYKLLLCLLVFGAAERLCRLQTHGFSYGKAVSAHAYPFTHCDKGIPRQLSQTFTYLGSGVQFYVFLGEDRKTVLKLFKHHHLGVSTDLIEKFLPKRLASPFIRKREKRMQHIFTSTQIAATELKEETGTLFLHIGKNPQGLGKTVVVDPVGIAHTIDLDKTDFVLQKRAIPASRFLHRLLKRGAKKEALSKMQEMITMIVSRSETGIKNKDGNILENCGFINGKPVELDIGSFIYRTKSTHPDPHTKTAMRATMQLLGWVKKHYPTFLNTCTDQLLHENSR